LAVKYRYPLLTTTLLTLAVIKASADDVVAIRINGHYFAEPAIVQVTVNVEPDEANRTLRVEADGDSFFRSSELTLDGLAEKRLHIVEFKNLPAGAYEVRAEVLSAKAVRGMATQDLEVMGTPGR
jgi:hypothetical protein